MEAQEDVVILLVELEAPVAGLAFAQIGIRESYLVYELDIDVMQLARMNRVPS